jgi:DNA-binding MarR family transcriptional regulator
MNFIDNSLVSIIKYIAQNEKPYSINIYRNLKISYTYLTSLLKELEKNGYISKELQRTDKRIKCFLLTPKGLKLYNLILELDKIIKK